MNLYQSPAKVAKLIGKSPKWIIDRCQEGKLPYIFKNGRYLINIKKIDEALDSLETESFEELCVHLSTKPVKDYLYN